MLESCVPGDVIHIDGFTEGGECLYVSVSKYVNTCLSFRDAQPLGSVQLDRDGAEFAGGAKFAADVLRALPPLGFCPFHLEAFAGPGGELIFCEIACRLGGGHIMETLGYATGVNPARLWIRHQAGLEDGPAVARKMRDAGPRYGFLLVPPRAGRLVDVREPAGLAFIKNFIVKSPVPKSFDGARHSADSVLAFVVEGHDSADLERNVRHCCRLAEDLTHWEEIYD
jgi:hypothetical protein